LLSPAELLAEAAAGFGTWFASYAAMTDENYVAALIWTICMLMFACSVVALTQHPDWFGA
jgi:hypothetical protein